MTTAVRFCVVRHGETGWNAEHRLQGHIDIALNATGIAQAHASAAQLAGHRFDAAYTSDLARAADTARIIATQTGVPATPCAELRERHYGLFQGLTHDQARSRHPEAYRRFEAREADFAFPDGGESLTGFAARIHRAFDQLADHHPGEQVLVVCHGGVLDILYRRASARALEAPRDFAIPNAALNWVVRDATGWRIDAWAQAAHLAAARDELPNA
ncbi:MAG: histidine phosphatase family protein [Rhodocyclaceae bacterium]|nr:histidine phosphatase family protein [Rhodocyclaceae bacterium]